MPKLKRFLLILLCCTLSVAGFSTVKGQDIIDFIGFDSQTNSISFKRIDWSDSESPKEIYTYWIDKDSLEVFFDWGVPADTLKNENEIFETEGLTSLAQLTSTDLPYFIWFRWEPEVSYDSNITGEETVSFPFKISIFKQEYYYYQCSKESGEPNVIHFKIDDDSGLVFVNFQGDCFEGRWKDSLIFYSKKDGRKFSKRLTVNDLIPLDFFRMKRQYN